MYVWNSKDTIMYDKREEIRAHKKKNVNKLGNEVSIDKLQ